MSFLLRTSQIICTMKRNIEIHPNPLKRAWHTAEFSLQYTATITTGPKTQETLIRLVHTTEDFLIQNQCTSTFLCISIFAVTIPRQHFWDISQNPHEVYLDSVDPFIVYILEGWLIMVSLRFHLVTLVIYSLRIATPVKAIAYKRALNCADRKKEKTFTRNTGWSLIITFCCVYSISNNPTFFLSWSLCLNECVVCHECKM